MASRFTTHCTYSPGDVDVAPVLIEAWEIEMETVDATDPFGNVYQADIREIARRKLLITEGELVPAGEDRYTLDSEDEEIEG